MVNVGDKVKLDYITDGNPHNGQVGTVIRERKYKYYPNRNPDEFVLKQCCTIQYPDGTKEYVNDTEREGSGLVSPLVEIKGEYQS